MLERKSEAFKVYSAQTFYCNACGQKCEVFATHMMGGKFLGWRVCSSECVREIRWRETLSIMGLVYSPRPLSKDESEEEKNS
jgi:hypothetical protein